MTIEELKKAFEDKEVCPTCGKCPTCGRGNSIFPDHTFIPMPYIPPTTDRYPSWQGWITYC